MGYLDICKVLASGGFTRVAIAKAKTEENKDLIENVVVMLRHNTLTNIDEYCFIMRKDNRSRISADRIYHIEQQIINNSILIGKMPSDIMNLIITDDEYEKGSDYAELGMKFWVMDEISGSIRIYENQPEEYCGLKDKLEAALCSNISVKEILNHVPIVSILLLIANVLVFVAMESIGNTEDTEFLLSHGANYWPYVFENGEWYRLFTCIFIHIGGYHLLSNMIALIFVGNTLEKSIGKAKFILIYFISGLGASFFADIFNYSANNMVVSAGASGAIYGILGALVYVMLKYRKNANWGIVIILILMVSSGFSQTGIDNVAHIVGCVIGIISAVICCKRSKNILI